MTSRRTDNPRKLTVALSEEAHRLLDALAQKLTASDPASREWSRTDVLEAAIRRMAKAERLQ